MFNHHYFAQDDWKVTRNLTLNMGLRSEVTHGTTEVNGVLSNLNLDCRDSLGAAGSGPLGCFTIAQPSNKAHVNWGPRFGFAWNPRGDTKTVIRGGYGIAYDFLFLNPITNQRTLPPFIITADLRGAAIGGANSYANLVAGTALIQQQSAGQVGKLDPTVRNYGSIVPIIDRNLRNPQVQQWSLGVQRELFNDFVLKASYIGSKSDYLQRTRPLNLTNDARLRPATSPADEAARLSDFRAMNSANNGGATTVSNRIDPRFNDVRILESSGNSNYHSLELLALKTFRHGYYFQTGYTVGKSIDDNSDALGVLINDSSLSQNPRDLRSDRGPSQFDVRHRIVMTHTFEPEWGRNISHGWMRRLATGWGFAGISSWRSGFPVTLDAGGRLGIAPISITGSPTPVRPNTSQPFDFKPVPAGSAGAPNGLNSDPVQRISAYAASLGLSQPLLGNFGNLGRNTHRLNGEVNFDWNVYKNTQITERVKFQLRAEFYNIFNNVAFQDVNRNIAGAAFGQYTTTAHDSRNMQVGARVIF